jgi:hypothetical protein
MSEQTIRCSKCGYEVPLTEAFTHQIEDKLGTAGMYGDLQAIIGNALTAVKTLELPGDEERPTG